MEGLLLMVEKGIFGLTLIRKQRYWPMGVSEEEIIWNIQLKKLGDVDSLPNRIFGKIYHILDLKDTDYIMLSMPTYNTLEML